MLNAEKNSHSWAWLDYLGILVVSVSAVSISLLVMDAFSPKQALLLGASVGTVSFYALRKKSISIADGGGVGLLPLLALVLLAAVFRLEPYPWINGGQDQGVYVSMSAHYQNGGSIFITDPVSSRLVDTGLAALYKANLPTDLPKDFFQPGVYYGGDGDYVFQFYHLHPLWMAISAELFGDDARVYSLTFFSLLSIVFLSLLTFELSNSRVAAVSVGLLLAVNPLHAFFSKWPVTEVVALAFSSMAFYYLARAYRLGDSVVHARWALVVACLSLSMLFFVRISGFLYLPLLLLIFMLGTWLQQVRGERIGKDLAVFSVACVGFYVLSVFYGLKFSPNYSVSTYAMTFGKLAGGHWAAVMSGMLGGMLLIMYVWRNHLCHGQIALKLSSWARPHVMTLVLIVLLFAVATLSLFQVYRLGYTDAYATHPWLATRWSLSGAGMAAVERSSLLNWMIYSSPFLVAIGVIALLRRRADLRLALLLVVPVTSLSVFVLSNPALPYQYYYARYLLTEAVPYAIVIFVVATVGSGAAPWRKAGIVAVVLSVLWFGYFTTKQWGAEEGGRPLNVLSKIAANVDEQDVLLIEPSGWTIPKMVVETPLRFYFGLNTFALPADARRENTTQIAGSFRRIWLLSPKPVDEENFLLSERLLHYDKVVERVGHVPLKVVDDFWHQELYLYEMKKPGWPSGQGEPFRFDLDRYPIGDYPEVATVLGAGWRGIEKSHVWSSGNAELVFDAEMFAEGRLPDTIVLDIAPFAASEGRTVTVNVTACGSFVRGFSYQSSEKFQVRVPIAGIENQTRCYFRLEVENAISPAALGFSDDSRELGVALHAVTFE